MVYLVIDEGNGQGTFGRGVIGVFDSKEKALAAVGNKWLIIVEYQLNVLKT